MRNINKIIPLGSGLRLFKADNYKKAMERQLKLMSVGLDLGTGGTMAVSRVDLYEHR